MTSVPARVPGGDAVGHEFLDPLGFDVLEARVADLRHKMANAIGWDAATPRLEP